MLLQSGYITMKFLFSLLIFLSALLVVLSKPTPTPNVCKTFDDYMHIENNTNCWYSPDIELDAIALIQKYGYPAETHNVTTDDGYILTLFRLPRNSKKAKGIVLLQHPALTCGTLWVDKGKESLAFQLWDVGFDVWISNSRGTIYSRTHVNMSVDDPEFWNTSQNEMGVYDMPAQVKLIRKVTKTENKGPNMAFVGHSMGGTIGLIYASAYAEDAAKNFKVIVGLAPAAGLRHYYIPIFDMIPRAFEWIKDGLNEMELRIIAPKDISDVVKWFCAHTNAGVEFCANMIYFAMGADTYKDQVMPVWMPGIFSHSPGGTPMHVFVHYMQNGVHKKFQPYDYGPEENLKRYNSTTVKEYPIEDILAPMLLISGNLDILIPMEDTYEIFKRIKSESAKKYGHYVIPGFNHFDFVYGKKSIELYKNLVNFFLKKVFV